MDRLTTTIELPPDGTFKVYSDEERKKLKSVGDVSEKEIYRRLQAYEDTWLSPEEITALKAVFMHIQIAAGGDRYSRLGKGITGG